jgi:hypothetical protein
MTFQFRLSSSIYPCIVKEAIETIHSEIRAHCRYLYVIFLWSPHGVFGSFDLYQCRRICGDARIEDGESPRMFCSPTH